MKRVLGVLGALVLIFLALSIIDGGVAAAAADLVALVVAMVHVILVCAMAALAVGILVGLLTSISSEDGEGPRAGIDYDPGALYRSTHNGAKPPWDTRPGL